MPTWTSAAVKAYLESKKTAFQDAQDANKLEDFWVLELANFFEEFPTLDAETGKAPRGSQNAPLEAQAMREAQRDQSTSKDVLMAGNMVPIDSGRRAQRTKQIKDWFYNATRKSRQSVSLNVVVREKEDHIPSVKQMWSKKYYGGSEVQKAVDAEIANDNVCSKKRLAIYHKHVNQAFADAGPEVHETLTKERDKLIVKKREDEEAVARLLRGDMHVPLNPEEIAKVQESVVTVLKNFLTMLQGRTGDWTFCLLAGGPFSGQTNAPIQVEAFDIGGLPDGRTFSDWYPAFSKMVELPFAQFCHVVYPEEMRLRRAIVIDETKLAKRESLALSGRAPGRMKFTVPVTSTTNEPQPEPSATAATETPTSQVKVSHFEGPQPARRKRGRPPKNKQSTETPSGATASSAIDSFVDAPATLTLPPSAIPANTEPYTGIQNTATQQFLDTMPQNVGMMGAGMNALGPNTLGAMNIGMADTVLGNAGWQNIGMMNSGGQSGSTGGMGPHSVGAMGVGPQNIGAMGVGPQNVGMLNMQPENGVSSGAMQNVGTQNVGVQNICSTSMGVANVEGRSRMQQNIGMQNIGVQNVGMADMPGMSFNPSYFDFSGFNFDTNTDGNQATCGSAMSNSTIDGYGFSNGFSNGEERMTGGVAGDNEAMRVDGMSDGIAGGLFLEDYSQPQDYILPPPTVSPSFNQQVAEPERTNFAAPHNPHNPYHQVQNNPYTQSTSTSSGNAIEPVPQVSQRDNGSSAPDAQGGGGIAGWNWGGLDGSGNYIGGGGAESEREPRAQRAAKRGPVATKKVTVSKVDEADAEEDDDDDDSCSRRKRSRRNKVTVTREPWVEETKAYLLKGMDDEDWADCVERWCLFEDYCTMRAGGMSGRLNTEGRPEELKLWLMNRSYKAVPEISDKRAFGKQWRVWWNGIQPATRKNAVAGALPRPAVKSMDMSTVRKGGHVGIVVAMIGLRFWAGAEGMQMEWEEAVEDLSTCLKQWTT